MNKWMMTGAAVVAVVSLQGCIVVSESGKYDDEQYQGQADERENRDIIASLDMQTSLQAVKRRLGTPEFSDRWQEQSHQYEVLYYRTHRKHSDGMTTRDECTPIVFKDGQLVGTGDLAMSQLGVSND